MGLGESYDRWKSQDYERVPPVILASGPETQLKSEFVESLHADHPEDPELLTLYADETSPQDLLQELRGQGLFNQEKWVVLKHLDHSSGGSSLLTRYLDDLKDYVQDPEPSTTLVLFDGDHPYTSGRSVGSLAESVQSSGGWSIIFWEPFDDSLRETIGEKLSEAGLSYDPSAVKAILRRTKGKYSRIIAETEKLIEVSEDRVTVDAVESVVSLEEAPDTFDSLKRNVISENLSELLRDYDEFWRRNESPPRVVHVLFDFLSDLRTLRQLTAEGKSLEDALSDIGRPTSKTVKNLYKRGLNWVRKGMPKTFFRQFYEGEKYSKYASEGLDELAVEMTTLNLLNPPERR